MLQIVADLPDAPLYLAGKRTEQDQCGPEGALGGWRPCIWLEKRRAHRVLCSSGREVGVTSEPTCTLCHVACAGDRNTTELRRVAAIGRSSMKIVSRGRSSQIACSTS